MRYNEAAAEVKALLDQIDWTNAGPNDAGKYPYRTTTVVERGMLPDGTITINVQERICIWDEDWDNPPEATCDPPSINLLSFGYIVAGRTDTASEQQYTKNPGPTENRETDWIAISRFGGEEINTMDGFTGLSKQVIRVSLFSLDRERVSIMADEVLSKINNFTGATPRGLDFQCCLLDEVFDNNDEESSINGMDMFFVVVVSG